MLWLRVEEEAGASAEGEARAGARKHNFSKILIFAQKSLLQKLKRVFCITSDITEAEARAQQY